MSRNQLSTFLRRDSNYDYLTPITEKEAYDLTKTVINLFEENGICYNIQKTKDSSTKPKMSLKRTSTGFSLKVGVIKQIKTAATIVPIEGRLPDGKSLLRWN